MKSFSLLQRLQKFVLGLLLGLAIIGGAPSLSSAFLYEVPILEKSAQAELSDEDLIDVYTEVMIELEAAGVFHKVAGFNPKEYKKYKELLRFRVNIIREFQRRALPLPEIKPPS